MADGLTVSNEANSKFERYHQFPHWDPVQQRQTSEGQGHYGDYHISLNDSGNVMYFTANEGQGQTTGNISHSNKGHVSPRKWHHGDIRTDLMKDNSLRQSNNANIIKEDFHMNTAVRIDPVKNQGQITIHYNDLDLKDAFAENKQCDVGNVKNKNKKTYNTTHGVEKENNVNYNRLKREYLDRSRAKERDYTLYNKREDLSNDLKSPRAIIRYDIEAPIGGRIQYVDIQPHDDRVEKKAKHYQTKPINAAVAKGGTADSSPMGLSPSVTLPKFNAATTINTRFGSHDKVTAYRPGTCLDNHRKQKLENIIEAPVNDIDLEEGRKIWKEVDAFSKEPLVPPSNPRRRMNYKLRDIHTSNNSVEFWPSFEKEPRNNRAIENNIWRENMENLAMGHNTNDQHSWRNILDPSKSPKAIHLGKYESQRPRGLLLNEEESRYRRAVDKFGINPNQAVRRNAISAPLLQATDYNGNVTLVSEDGHYNQPVYHSIDTMRLLDPRTGDIHVVYPAVGASSQTYVQVPEDRACKGTKPRMTTTLPRITPANTPLPPGVCQAAAPRSHSSASMYGAYPPKELSSSMDFIRIPGRVNPLAPNPPKKRINWTWETTNQHWENDKRRILMQKREHTRYHSAWGKAFYGAPAEKEAYRRHYRDVLKQQMSDRENSRRDELINKVKETDQAVKYDEQCRTNDAQEYFKKHSYLMLYRDGNKEQMENKWAEHRHNKVVEDRVDRERLRYNPINWSCSLK